MDVCWKCQCLRSTKSIKILLCQNQERFANIVSTDGRTATDEYHNTTTCVPVGIKRKERLLINSKQFSPIYIYIYSVNETFSSQHVIYTVWLYIITFFNSPKLIMLSRKVIHYIFALVHILPLWFDIQNVIIRTCLKNFQDMLIIPDAWIQNYF